MMKTMVLLTLVVAGYEPMQSYVHPKDIRGVAPVTDESRKLNQRLGNPVDDRAKSQVALIIDRARSVAVLETPDQIDGRIRGALSFRTFD